MIRERNIALCIIFSIITCNIYGFYWYVCLTDDSNTACQTMGTSGIVSFLLLIVTCGIYGLFWAYKMGEKIDAAKQQRGILSSNSGVLYLILFIVSAGIIPYALMQYELNKIAAMR